MNTFTYHKSGAAHSALTKNKVNALKMPFFDFIHIF
jgi:hypothetical protein